MFIPPKICLFRLVKKHTVSAFLTQKKPPSFNQFHHNANSGKIQDFLPDLPAFPESVRLPCSLHTAYAARALLSSEKRGPSPSLRLAVPLSGAGPAMRAPAAPGAAAPPPSFPAIEPRGHSSCHTAYCKEKYHPIRRRHTLISFGQSRRQCPCISLRQASGPAIGPSPTARPRRSCRSAGKSPA